MKRLTIALALIPVLAILAGCGAPDQSTQPPFTAAELTKFVSDVPDVIYAINIAVKAGDIPPDDRHETAMAALKVKLTELGWDKRRYDYIYTQCFNMIGETKLAEEAKQVKNRAAKNPYSEEAQQKLQMAEFMLAKMREVIEHTIPVSEQVLIHERIKDLDTLFDGPAMALTPFVENRYQ